MLQKTGKFSVFSGPIDIICPLKYVVERNTSRKPSGLGDSYENCHDMYDAVYASIPSERSCQTSLNDREDMNARKDFTLTYGELNSMEPMWKLLHKAHEQSTTNALSPTLSNKIKFYDLGSGSGRPCIAAALALSNIASRTNTHPDIQCIGIEILPGLYELSLLAQEKWIEYSTKIKNSSIDKIVLNYHFYLGSIFDLTLCDWTDGDVVYVNSTCFDVKMLLQVYEISTKMKKGSIIITLSRSMIEIEAVSRNIRDKGHSTREETPVWEILFESREEMSW